MLPHLLCRFHLRDDYHQEIGWRDFVRDQASQNPLVIRSILEKRARYDFGHDPRTLFERWEPYTLSYMFYFWMIRPGQTAPSFVATDGVFSMIIDPLPRNEHLLGLPADLQALVQEALTRVGTSSDPCPVLPLQAVASPERVNVLPVELVVHRYADSIAYLRPCGATLQALADDPIRWAEVEQKR